jgi:hypothetical protein
MFTWLLGDKFPNLSSLVGSLFISYLLVVGSHLLLFYLLGDDIIKIN